VTRRVARISELVRCGSPDHKNRLILLSALRGFPARMR